MALFRGTGGSGDASTDTYASEVALEATRASTKANEAAASATSAANAQAAAETAQVAAETAKTNAETAETNAETAETNAETAENAAVAAKVSAETAKTAADTAQSAAEVAKTAAETAETNAETAETNAAASATTATTKAGEAATSATNAASSASSASTSATNAATSATAAQTAQTAAEAAKTAAEAAQDAIDGLYLGAQSSNPTVDLNGNAVTTGDWYFNTSDNTTRIYDGSGWNTINPDLVGDTSPQLGGNLDLNSRNITGTGNVNITGNVVLSGTVDGRDVAADGTKLDGVEASATADQTAAEIRTLVESASDSNVFTDADHSKLNAIEAGATADQTATEIKTLVGSASDSNVFTDADHSKLDGIEASATADQTAAEIRTLVESASDSNVFTDADHSKLNAIEASATADQTDAEIRAAVEAATDSNVFTDADHSKLNAIEASADVTDTANVTAAGALMDSEVTNLSQVKAFDTSDYATAAQGAKADTAHGWGNHASAGYLTGNQTITLSGAVTGSGTTSITTTLSTIDGGNLLMTTIKLKNGSGAPAGGDLVQGEPALDLTNKRLYTEDSGGTVIEVGTNPGVDVTFADNRKAIFGAGSDLQIYHDGNNSYVSDTGSGSLYLRGSNQVRIESSTGEKYFIANVNSDTNLYYDNLAKLATTSTGIDVTGTVTADGLTVDASTSSMITLNHSTPSNLTTIGQDSSGDFRVRSDNVNKLKSYANGDFELYEDTGTTAKFFWDASAESLGIGTSSVSNKLSIDVTNTNTGTPFDSTSVGVIALQNTSTTANTSTAISNKNPTSDSANSFIQFINEDGAFKSSIAFGTATAGASNFGERMRIDSSGNVGIGTDSPRNDANFKTLQIGDSSTAASQLVLDDNDSSGPWRIISNLSLIINDDTDERMRIDSSGGVLIGTTVNYGSFQGGYVLSKKGYVFAADNTGSTDNRNWIIAPNGSAAGSLDFIDSSSNTSWPNNAYRMSITKDGNVGIGTSSIDLTSSGRTVVQVEGSSNALLNLTDGTSRLYLHQKGGTSGADIWNSADSYMRFATNDAEAMRIDSAGNLLVGTTTANDVNNIVTNHLFEGANSTAGAGAVGVYNNTGTANCPALVVLNRDASTDTSNRFIQFYADVTSSSSTAMGGIVGNGASNVQFAALSDAREKTNIESISGSLDKINTLNPVEFDWIASGEHVSAGFVAQEVEQVFPEFVVENMADEGAEERKGLTGGMTGGIVAHLVKAIQEQNELINDLRARVAQLETN